MIEKMILIRGGAYPGYYSGRYKRSGLDAGLYEPGSPG